MNSLNRLSEPPGANVLTSTGCAGLGRIEVVHSDALNYDLPPDPELLFLYDPFGEATMKAVAERTRASWVANPRELRVLYLNPFHLNVWTEAGFTNIRRASRFSLSKAA